MILPVTRFFILFSCLLFDPIASAGDIYNLGMMQEAVEYGSGGG